MGVCPKAVLQAWGLTTAVVGLHTPPNWRIVRLQATTIGEIRLLWAYRCDGA